MDISLYQPVGMQEKGVFAESYIHTVEVTGSNPVSPISLFFSMKRNRTNGLPRPGARVTIFVTKILPVSREAA
jgi:hypothetical protein